MGYFAHVDIFAYALVAVKELNNALCVRRKLKRLFDFSGVKQRLSYAYLVHEEYRAGVYL